MQSAMRIRVVALCVLYAVLPCGRDAWAAQRMTGAIAGTVRGDAGNELAGATVTVSNQSTGLERSAVTDDRGQYVVGSLPVEGDYDLRVELAGYAPATRQRVTLAPGDALEADVRLSVALAETIAVRVGTPLLERRLSAVQQRIDEPLTRSLPLFGRNFLELASLAAGFTGNAGVPNAQGQTQGANNVLVDGASHFSKWRSAPRAFYAGYGLEAIREVQVLTNVFSAEFGETLGSVTSAVTKAGTNDWHGSALFFDRDEALNAVPAFTDGKPPSSAQQFGATLGGPLVKGRTHFFGSYEGRRVRDSNIVSSPAAEGVIVPDRQDEHLAFFRVDHQGPNHLLTGRYNGQRFRWHREPGGLTLPGSGTRYLNDVQTVLLTDSIQVTGRVFNEVRAQAARYVDRRQDLQATPYVSRAGYAIEGGALGPVGFGADPEDTWEAADTLSVWKSAHAVKAGGGVKWVRARNASIGFGRGAYFYAGPPDLAPQPYQFVQGIAAGDAATAAEPRSLSAFGFVQDDWIVSSRLTLNLGLRYDVERISHLAGYAVPVDADNLQPRAGATWDPTGDGRTVLHAGVGLYTQQHLLYPLNRVQLEGADGIRTVTLTPDEALFPMYPAVLPAFTGGLLPPSDIHRVDPGFTNPYSLQYAAGLERLLGRTVLAVDAVHLAGHDLMSLVDVNAPVSIVEPAQRSVAAADATRPLLAVPGTFRKVLTLGNEGRSWYRAVQVKARRSVAAFHVTASYTLSRAEDMANYELPEDSRNLAAEKGRAATDVTHNAAAGLTWDLPGAGRALGGWSLSGIGLVRSGRPYTITWGDDRNGTTQNDARPGARNTARTGAFRTVDLAVIRRVRRRWGTAEARLETFNLFNAVNYDRYVGELLSPLFGRPVSAFPKRRLQLAAVVRF
jgi:hypothetical protein